MNNPKSRRVAVVTGGAGGTGAALADRGFTTGAAIRVDGGMHVHPY